MIDRHKFSYRWNPIIERWQFFTFHDLEWRKSIDYSGGLEQESMIRSKHFFDILKYEDTWCEEERDG